MIVGALTDKTGGLFSFFSSSLVVEDAVVFVTAPALERGRWRGSFDGGGLKRFHLLCLLLHDARGAAWLCGIDRVWHPMIDFAEEVVGYQGKL